MPGQNEAEIGETDRLSLPKTIQKNRSLKSPSDLEVNKEKQ